MTNTIDFNAGDNRYEIHVDGTLAGFTQAFVDGDVVTFPHTVVLDEFEGQGLASQLVAAALDDVRAKGLKVIATCPYVSRFIKKHAEYADLLA
ncbi:GNAT family N-acetyltransferase [Aeromicrobium panaciterrae]|uniref:GNAT family N-acetyltransferase n=1 Tax=Aeromicrobium panaciterrae TaxID=363861 RepID=UPI0031D08BA0